MLALVSCRAALTLDTDLPLLRRELPAAEVVCWDDDTVDWGGFAAVVVRSAWDYHTRLTDFLRWAEHVSDKSTLWNSIEVIEWNTDKRYLSDLAARGIPIVPTTFCDDADSLAGLPLDGDVVVKPTVGAGSNGVVRYRRNPGAAATHARSLLAADLTVMVQPYVTGVDDVGETGLVYVGGTFSHAFRKGAILAAPVEFEGGLMAVETSRPHTATAAERSLGDRVISAVIDALPDVVPGIAYARIDLLPTPDGPVLLEVELTEPSLFLHHDAGAAERAAAVFRSLTA